MSRDEVKDRLEIKNLIDAYAHNADRRKVAEYVGLYAEEATIRIYMGDPGSQNEISFLNGVSEIEKGFREHLMPYEITQHFICQNTVRLNGDRAEGEVYTLAHNIWTENGVRTLMVMGVRYEDTYIHRDNRWFFLQRKLMIDWTSKRPL